MNLNQIPDDKIACKKPLDQREEAVSAKERDLFKRLLRVKVYPAVLEKEAQGQSVDCKLENK
jgi:hypothetical protein